MVISQWTTYMTLQLHIGFLVAMGRIRTSVLQLMRLARWPLLYPAIYLLNNFFMDRLTLSSRSKIHGIKYQCFINIIVYISNFNELYQQCKYTNIILFYPNISVKILFVISLTALSHFTISYVMPRASIIFFRTQSIFLDSSSLWILPFSWYWHFLWRIY